MNGAGEGTRTLDIQLGKLTACDGSDCEIGSCESGDTDVSRYDSSAGARQCDARTHGATDVELEEVIGAWPQIPREVRAGIIALVKALVRKRR